MAAGTGAEGSVGVLVNNQELGVFGSVGGSVGVNLSGDILGGVVRGGARNVSGGTVNFNIAIGPISISIFVDPKTGNVIGGTIGAGPSVTPVGGSLSMASTGTLYGPHPVAAPCSSK